MIRLHELSKNYGRFTAVDRLSLEVPKGELFGLLGPTGAGKTTTLRMIAGILQPTSGRVTIGGKDIHDDPEAAKAKLGFIPDRPYVYEKLTGAEFLRFVAALFGQEGPGVERRMDALLALFELAPWKDELTESYSLRPGSGRRASLPPCSVTRTQHDRSDRFQRASVPHIFC
jgi:ABC-2 type transport system ATP-binding protein